MLKNAAVILQSFCSFFSSSHNHSVPFSPDVMVLEFLLPRNPISSGIFLPGVLCSCSLFFCRNLYSWIPFPAFPVVFTYAVLILLFGDSLHHEVGKYLSCLDIICSVSASSNHQLIYLRIFTDNQKCVMCLVFSFIENT